MEWKNGNALPDKTGEYVVMIRIIEGTIRLGVAHFREEYKKWYKFDPFTSYYVPKEEIAEMVQQWVKT